jgi:hypothetical protein
MQGKKKKVFHALNSKAERKTQFFGFYSLSFHFPFLDNQTECQGFSSPKNLDQKNGEGRIH